MKPKNVERAPERGQAEDDDQIVHVGFPHEVERPLESPGCVVTSLRRRGFRLVEANTFLPELRSRLGRHHVGGTLLTREAMRTSAISYTSRVNQSTLRDAKTLKCMNTG